MSDQFIGVDVGGTKIAVACWRAACCRTRASSPTNQASQDELVEQIAAAIEGSMSSDVRAVGIGMPSIIEFKTGKILASVNIPLHDIPLRDVLTERMGVPVYVENDAGCAALAEAFDDGRITVDSLVMLTIGTGVGGGWVLNGRLYRGATTSAAEVGHTIIGRDLEFGNRVPGDPFPQRGSLETLASGRALDRLADYAAMQYPDSFLGKQLVREGRDRRPRRGRGRRGRRRRVAVVPARARRADRDRDRERDQHVRPARGRDRRRRLARGRAAARAGPRRRVPARRARAGTEHEDPDRASRRRAPGVLGAALIAAQEYAEDALDRAAHREASKMKIACAFDHAGFPLKPMVLETVAEAGHEVIDLGTWSTDPVDYPDTARMAAEAVRNGDADRAVLVCGSGAGVAVAACKFPGIRAVVAHDTYTAHQSVEHDDCNILCLGGRVIGPALAADIIRAYLAAEFTGEDRHKRRLAKIDGIEREFLRDDI